MQKQPICYLSILKICIIHIPIDLHSTYVRTATGLYRLKETGTNRDSRFPDSTLRGNTELGDNNQVQVALVVIYLCSSGIIGGKTVVESLGE